MKSPWNPNPNSLLARRGHQSIRCPLLTSGVAVGNDKLAGLALEVVGSPDDFVEQSDQAGVEALGAVAVLDEIRVGHVRLVVLGIDVLSVPARRESQLETNAVGAVLVEVLLGGHEVAEQRSLRGLGVIQAVETESALLEVGLRCLAHGSPVGLRRVGLGGVAEGVVTAQVASGDHLEALGEGLDVVLGVTEQVVTGFVLVVVPYRRQIRVADNHLREHASNLLDGLESAIVMLEVHVGSPVGRHVLLGGARSAVSSAEILVARSLRET